MATVSTVFRKDKLNKKGIAPVNFRVIKDRKIYYVTTDLKLTADEWDEKNTKVKPKHKNSVYWNNWLAAKNAELQNDMIEMNTNEKSLTGRQLRDGIYGKKPTDFFVFANEVCEEYKLAGQIGTYDKNKSILAKLKAYPKSGQLCFQDITPEFLEVYSQYLKTEHKNKTNTVNKDFKFIRKVFNDAYRKGIIEHKVNPFNNYKMKTDKTNICFLLEDELSLFENVATTPGTRLELHRDMFVFAGWTAGIRISDLLQLQWKNFNGTQLDFTIKKTKTQLSIKVPNKGLALINKYKPEKPNKNAFLFPVFSEELDLNNPVAVDQAISGATAYINKNLKILAKKAEIDKNISFHVSRHTWATIALRKGVTLLAVSKLLGHSNIRETMIYAKIVNPDLDLAMDKFND